MYIPAIPPLRQARITIILLSVFIILLLFKKSRILFHQSLNFILSLSNYLRSKTMLFGILACLLFISAGIPDITVFVLSFIYSKVSSMICKDSNYFDNTSMSSILLELILISLCSLHYICFI